MIQDTDHNSALGWIDFSSEHRAKVRTVIDLLGERGVIDELGIGVIRDSFSDSLFPGISTIQTRAKYYLTVPRILRDYEHLDLRSRRKQSLSDYLRKSENECMLSLARNHKEDPQTGIIGIEFFDKPGEVQRKPSSVYWNGIRLFGLVNTKLSLQEFTRKFANPEQPLHDLIKGDDEKKGDDHDAYNSSGSIIELPSWQNSDWINDLNLNLSFDESQFLATKIAATVPNSLLGQVLMDSEVRMMFCELADNISVSNLFDDTNFVSRFDENLQSVMFGASAFWHLLKGAHIRYNILIQRKQSITTKKEEFEQEWSEWLSSIDTFPWDRWNTDFIWQLASRHGRQIREYTKQFVTDWIAAIEQCATNEFYDELVIRQERLNKKPLARLQDGADYRQTNWVGIRDLDFRFTQARTIVRDIHRGLNEHQEESDARL
ncbi:DUF6361 family protein [Rubinisphaera italica]|uniref:Uncharacterized protein n=1 Tax=Rubinisphaera italica TaxID=2527969 RepID=A0A5C5XIL8_9PLAN|nr:DUF6361 family protein [Rubinisphaera italica]TWT62860.1 hypothetical protein Pan54_36060 [Rubinisphaera italica]